MSKTQSDLVQDMIAALDRGDPAAARACNIELHARWASEGVRLTLTERDECAGQLLRREWDQPPRNLSTGGSP